MKKTYLTVRVADLKPYENNPRNNDGAVEAVKESISQVGYISPIVVDENMEVLAGHTRLKAISESERTEVDVLLVEGLTDEQKKKYRLLDNKTNEFASWDFEKLADELEGLDFGDFDFGFNDPGVAKIDEPGNFDESDFNYKEQYGVTVICDDAAMQERVYNELTSGGYECKVVTV